MKTTIFTTTTLLATLATATPLVQAQSPITTATNYKLIARMMSGNRALAIDNYAVSSYHSGAGFAHAQLLPQTMLNRVFYANGTYNTLSDEGNGNLPLFPAGVEVAPPANETAMVPVEINAAWGPGTQGIGIKTGEDEAETVLDYKGGQWSVCNQTAWQPTALQLFWQQGDDAKVPEGCVVVSLYPQCEFFHLD